MAGAVVRLKKIDGLPGHVRRGVGRQEQGPPGDILGLRPFRSGVGRDLAGGHTGLDPVRIEAVDPHAVLPDRLSQRCGVPDDTPFGGAVSANHVLGNGA